MPETEVKEPKLLAKGKNADPAVLTVFLQTMGLWDVLSIADRQSWITKAEVRDTDGGRLLFKRLKAAGIV